MSETSTAETRNRIRIFINDEPFFAPSDSMTGQELLTLAGLPLENQLFLEVPGPGEDQQVDPHARIELRSGQKFYDVPVGTLG